MSYKIYENKLLCEKYYFYEHENGLKIYVFPKKNYSSKYVVFGTKFGSVNNKFKTDNGDIVDVPDGTAHFLEHKLFEKENHSAFDCYAKTGASANAYTSFEKTAYLFSCSENFYESLEVLLDFVQKPYFSEQSVAKEQGIIGQEIQMYQDSPGWRVLINLLQALYRNHPVKIDIAGSVDSIAKITPKMLYDCYDAYYNPSNMALCICGDVDPEEVFEKVSANLVSGRKKLFETKSIFLPEPEIVTKKFVSETAELMIPVFNFGFKEKAEKEYLSAEEYVGLAIIVNALASRTSNLYKNLIDQELINKESFDFEIMEGPYFLSIIFSGESKDPKKVAKMICSEIKNMKNSGINEEIFLRTKKIFYGGLVSSFDNVSTIANKLFSSNVTGREIFSLFDAIKNISYEKVNIMLKKVLNEENSALSVIFPKNKNQ